MTHHGTVEVYTRGGSDASLLAQHLDGSLALADSLRADVRVRLAAIPSADETLSDLGMFAFISLHLFSAGGRHLSAVADIVLLIERLEKLHIEEQEMI